MLLFYTIKWNPIELNGIECTMILTGGISPDQNLMNVISSVNSIVLNGINIINVIESNPSRSNVIDLCLTDEFNVIE